MAPTGAGVGDAVTAVQRAASMTANALSVFSHVTLLVVRSGGHQTTYLVTPDGEGSRKAADLLAAATGSTAVAVPAPDLSGVGVVRRLRFRFLAGTHRDTQSGADPAEQAQLLANALEDGQWLAIGLRRPGRWESRRQVRWLATRMAVVDPNHHSRSKDAVIASFWAGAADHRGADALLRQVASAMPGFDLPVSVTAPPQRWWRVGAWMATALAVWSGFAGPALLAGLAGGGVGGRAGSVVSGVGVGLMVAATAAALPFVAVGYAMGRGWVPSGWSKWRRGLASGLFPAPERYQYWYRGRWTPPTKGHQDSDGRQVGARQGNYPLSHWSFFVGPHLPVLLVAPHAGGVHGQMQTQSRPVPSVFRSRVGPFIGRDEFGNPAHLTSADLFGGVFASGRMGSGKTEFLHGLFGWVCLDRVRPCGLPDSLGARQAVVAIEEKGEGAEGYLQWARVTGDSTALVELADPGGWAIDMLSVPGTWEERGRFFGEMLRYVFDDGSVMASSFMAFASFGAAILALLECPEGREVLTDPEGAGLPEGVGFLELFYILVGGRGDEAAVKLAAAVAAESIRRDKLGQSVPGLTCARKQLLPYFEGVSPSSRASRVTAPTNKIFALLTVDHWWSGKRPTITWDQVLTEHRSVVVNVGPSIRKPGVMLGEDVGTLMASMLTYTLQHAIMRNCTGWRKQGRGVWIFCDELALLAGKSPKIITWFHDQGRALGVRKGFATQRLGQLSEEVRASVMDYATCASFRQANEAGAGPVVRDLTADGSAWTVADMVTLAPFTMAVRTTAGDQRQPAFTCRAHHFSADPAGFAALQGWAESGP